MSRGVYVLLGAQLLTALADNALLFTAIAMLLAAPRGAWYVPALQGAFLVAFIVLAPWAGPFADRNPKPRVLLAGNLLKGAGACLMFVGSCVPTASWKAPRFSRSFSVPSSARASLAPRLVPIERLRRVRRPVSRADQRGAAEHRSSQHR